MVIQCDKCQTKFRLDDSKVTGAGIKVRCTKCQNVFIVRPPGYQDAPQEAAPPPPSGGQPPPPSNDQIETDKGAQAPLPSGGFEAPPPPSSTGADTGAAGGDAGYGAGTGADTGGDVDFKFGDESRQTEGNYGGFDFNADQPGGEASGGLEGEQGFQDSFGSGGFEPPSHDEEAPAPPPAQSDFGLGGIPQEPAPPQHDFGFGKIPQEPEMTKPAPASAAGGLDKDEFEFKTSDESATPEQKGVDDIMKEAFGGQPPPVREDADGKTKTRKDPAGRLKESLRKEDIKIHDEEVVKEKKTAAAKSEGMGAIIAAVIIIIAAGAVYFTGAAQTVKNLISPLPPAVKAVDVESVNGYFIENKNIGKIFVIDAVIRNTTGLPQSVGKVVGSIFDSKGAKLASLPGAPGRIASKDDLKNMSKDELTKAVKDTGGGVIPARTSVPVMMVFTETPAGVAEYGIEVGR
ncbi:MAG: zinc-ribbon domain-containing protein [Deltaproteobacteria bacterium]|nr:zinc-ribbon domain-containing protein [Deltaproteobacteria bacterium]